MCWMEWWRAGETGADRQNFGSEHKAGMKVVSGKQNFSIEGHPEEIQWRIHNKKISWLSLKMDYNIFMLSGRPFISLRQVIKGD